MLKLSIFPTLLDAWDYAQNAHSSWKPKALDDLVHKIRRDMPYETNPAVEAGQRLEELVQMLTMGGVSEDPIADTEPVKELVEFCRGGRWQEWVDTFVEVPSYGLVRVFGKVDVRFPIYSDKFNTGAVIDIKTTIKPFTVAKYLSGTQHHAFCLACETTNFIYAIVRWRGPEDYVPVRWEKVTYRSEGIEAEQAWLRNKIGDFYRWLKENSLYEDYLYLHCKNVRA